MNHLGGDGEGMWDDEDGFIYDVMRMPDGRHMPLKVRSMVGLIPLFAVETLEPRLLERFPGFRRRMEWFIAHRPRPHPQRGLHGGAGQGRAPAALAGGPRPAAAHPGAACWTRTSSFRHTASAASPACHRDHPYVLSSDGASHTGGLRTGRIAHRPVRRQLQLARAGVVPAELPDHRIAAEVPPLPGRRIPGGVPVAVGQADAPGGRGGGDFAAAVAAVSPGRNRKAPRSRAVRNGRRELVLFHEYFHGETGEGLGASHQTGWTALVAKLLQQSGE